MPNNICKTLTTAGGVANPLSFVAGLACPDHDDFKEDFVATGQNIGYYVYIIISTIAWVYAIYLSFQCMNGFNLGDFLVACCCSPCYIAYRLAVPCKTGTNL